MPDPRTRRPVPASSHLLVGLQLLALALCVVPLGGRQGGWWLLTPSVLGAALGLWTLAHNPVGNFSIYPEPRAGARLVRTGPYRYVRHPMYGALLLLCLGIALYNGGLLNMTGLVLMALVLPAKALREERHLVRRFPEYDTYRRTTRALIPFLW